MVWSDARRNIERRVCGLSSRSRDQWNTTSEAIRRVYHFIGTTGYRLEDKLGMVDNRQVNRSIFIVGVTCGWVVFWLSGLLVGSIVGVLLWMSTGS